MRRAFVPLALLTSLISACNLAGDITPPPSVATAQAARPPIQTPVGTTASASSSPPASRPNPEAGSSIYAEKCVGCHGPRGLGDGPLVANLPASPPPIGEASFAREAKPEDWYTIVSVGNRERLMPAFASLSDQERWDVVAYALTLSTTAEQVARGERFYAIECADCHGEDGVGADDVPDLSTPRFLGENSAADLYSALSQGVPEAMPSFGDSLSEAERWDLVAYVRTLAFSAAPAGELETTKAEGETSPSGAVRGQLHNGTAGMSVPEGLEVTLSGFDDEDQVISETARADARGEVIFEGLEPVPGRLFLLSAEHEGVTFRSEVAHFMLEEPTLDLPLTIYETTTDNGPLRLDRLHVLMEFPAEDTIRVLELWVLTNPTDRVMTAPAGGSVFEVALPGGAGNLLFEDGQLGERFIPTERGFGDTAPLIPGVGSAQLVFSFDMPYDRRLDFKQPIDHPVAAVNVLMVEGGPKVRGEGLEDQGVRDMGGIRLQNYLGGPLAPGETLAFTVRGRLAAAGGGTSIPGLVVGAGSLGLALVVVGLWWSRASGRSEGEGVVGVDLGEEGPPSGEVDERERLLRAIAALDDEFEAGGIPEDEYRQRREELKRRALELMRAADG